MPVTLTTVDWRINDDAPFVEVTYFQNEADAYKSMLIAFRDFVDYIGEQALQHDYDITPNSISLIIDRENFDTELFEGSIKELDTSLSRVKIFSLEG